MHLFFMIELIVLSLIYIGYFLLTISPYISEPITAVLSQGSVSSYS